MPVVTVSTIFGAAAALDAAPSPVVVIPVFDAYDDTARCLESVLAHTATDIAVLVVDDCGADRRTSSLLAAHADRIDHLIVVLEHPDNQGLVRSCNEAFAAVPGRDVVFLNSDVVVGAEWLTRLTAAAASSDTVATVTTLTNHGSIVSVPQRNQPIRDLPDGLTPREAARRVAAASRQLRPEIPTGIGHCLYVRRLVVDLIGAFDETFSPGYGEEVDFCQRAVAHGFRNILADDVFTYHHGSAAFGDSPAVAARRAEHEAVVRARYPWYANWVERAANDDTSPLADALTTARRAIVGLTVGVDGLYLGPRRLGTQHNTVETIRALAARDEIARLVVFLPHVVVPYVEQLRAELPHVEFIGIDLAAGIPYRVLDIIYRPYQVRTPRELEFLHRAGHRFVVNQLDTIAYDNPAYFSDTAEWMAYRDVTYLTLRSAAGVAFLSESSRQAAQVAGLLPDGQPSAVVFCGTDEPAQDHVASIDRFAPELRPGFLLCLGTSYLHKNRRFAMELLAELRGRGFEGQLVLAGARPPDGDSLGREAEFLIGNPSLRPHVVDLGSVDDDGRRALYQNAALVLYPSSIEGFGLVPFEAARHGVPTLSSRQGGLDEILPVGIPTLESFDVNDAADVAWKLLVDHEAAAELTQALVARSHDFTWAATAERLIGLFDAALARPRSRIAAIDGAAGRIEVFGGPPRTQPSWRAEQLEQLVQAVISRPALKRVLSPNGSRRQQLARGAIMRTRLRLQ